MCLDWLSLPNLEGKVLPVPRDWSVRWLMFSMERGVATKRMAVVVLLVVLLP